MEVFNTDGVVLKVRHTGESDRIVTVLTRDRGVIQAFAKAARRPKSRLHTGTQTFCYSDFSYTKRGETLNITEASVKTVFYDLNHDLKKLALAQYFSQLAQELIPPGDTEAESLRLLLNSFQFLCDEKKAPLLVKAVTELRIATIAGYAPDIDGCCLCGRETDAEMFLDCDAGVFYCRSCGGAYKGARLGQAAYAALRQIVSAPFARIYAVPLAGDALAELAAASERYILSQTERDYSTLAFYKSV